MRYDKCCVPTCDRMTDEKSARGMCRPHYKRWLKYGDALANVPLRNQRSAKLTLAEAFRYWMPEDPPPPGVIWEWRGALDKRGYGEMGYGNRTLKAHRVSYEIFREPIPIGMVIRHLNDIRLDVNPWNMTVGTQAQNMADARERGRMPRGGTHYSATATDEEVLEISRLFATGEWTRRQLAAKFQLKYPNVNSIIARRTWRYL